MASAAFSLTVQLATVWEVSHGNAPRLSTPPWAHVGSPVG